MDIKLIDCKICEDEEFPLNIFKINIEQFKNAFPNVINESTLKNIKLTKYITKEFDNFMVRQLMYSYCLNICNCKKVYDSLNKNYGCILELIQGHYDYYFNKNNSTIEMIIY